MFRKGYKMSEEHKRKIGNANRISLKGNIPWNKNTKGLTKSNSGSFKKGIVPWNKGKLNPFSKETLIKMSISNKNNWTKLSKELKERRIKGIKFPSEETKLKKSLSKKGKGLHKGICYGGFKTQFKKGHETSKEIRNKIGLANKNRKQTLKERIKKGISLKKAYLEGRKIAYWKGKTMSEETKEKLSKISKNNPKVKLAQFKKGQLPWNIGLKPSKEQIDKYKEWRRTFITPKKDTSIEVKIQNFLKQLGIDFLTHQYIKEIEHGYQCDILIPSMNLVIECDGDYWHKYPIGREIDNIRTKELLQKGFKVLRLWEFEIKSMDLNKFKEKLI